MRHALSKKIDNFILLFVNKNKCKICNSLYSKSNCLFVVSQDNFAITKQDIHKTATKYPVYWDDTKIKLAKNKINKITFYVNIICKKCGKIKAVKYPITKINSCR